MKKNQSSKRKLPNTWNKRDTVWAIMATICILIFVVHYSTLLVNAESPTSPMPYKPDSAPIYASFDYDSYLTRANFLNNILPAIKRDAGESYFNSTWSTYVLTVNDFGTDWESYMLCQYYTFNDSFFSGSSNLTFGGRCFQFIVFSNGTFQLNGNPVYNGSRSYSQIFGTDGISQGKHIGYPLYYVGTFNGLTFDVPNPPFVPNEGHATPTDFNNNDDLINYQPRQPNTPTFPTFPTIVIDTTSIETLLESIFDAVTSFADYVGQCFSTFFSWLVEVIQNGIQSIINTIRDFNDNIYNNLVSLFEPMFENIKHIVEPVQEEEILQAFEDTGIYQNFSSMTDLVNDSFDIFDSVSEPNTFRIPIHLENVSMLNCSTQYIDLGWFDSCKTALRAFMWCITTFGLLYTIIDALPSYISGGDE